MFFPYKESFILYDHHEDILLLTPLCYAAGVINPKIHI